jgi:hypothetical protein
MRLKPRVVRLERRSGGRPVPGADVVTVWIPANGRGGPEPGDVLRTGAAVVRVYDADAAAPVGVRGAESAGQEGGGRG